MDTDASGAISITGVVKKFEFTNPHSFVYLDYFAYGFADAILAKDRLSETFTTPKRIR
jgi:hypothetical protein